MADKVTLASVANIDNSLLTAINNNNALITTAMDNTLSRDGTTPNQMGSNLDMNSNQIFNLPPPATANSPIRLADAPFSGTIQIASVPPVGTSGAVVGLLNTNNTASGNNTYSGTSTFNNTATFNNPVTLANTNTVSGNTTFSGTLTSNNTATFNNPVTLANTATLSGSVAFTSTNGPTYIPATGAANIFINPTQASQQAALFFEQTNVNQWAVGKDTSNNFFIQDSVGSRNVAQCSTTNGAFTIRGTTTNDSAPTGFVGEYVSSIVSSGSAVGLTTSVSANITSISLTAGDWDVFGSVYILPAATTTLTALTGSISTTSSSLNLTAGNFFQNIYASFTPNAQIGSSIGTVRLSLASTTTVFLVVQTTFGTSTNSGFGALQARRVR